jgi:acyl carrier protein
MTLEEFVIKFAEVFDETPQEQFTPSTQFKNLEEWSSLSALSVIAMVDEECDVEINGQDIRNCETITDLFNLVNSRK